MRVATATSPFFYSFQDYFKDLQVFQLEKDDVRNFDLMIFTGGEDINPQIYGIDNTYSSFNMRRDGIELEILRNCLNSQIKILGVCRGHQLINAYMGGSLVQDIYLETNEVHESSHKLNFFGGQLSIIKYLYENKNVNSMHHQGVIQVGRHLKTTSSYKGVIESCESQNIITVQFHPEFMGDGEFFDIIKRWVTDRDSLITEISGKTQKPKVSTSVKDIDWKKFKDTFRESATAINFEEIREFAVGEIPPPAIPNPRINRNDPFTLRLTRNADGELIPEDGEIERIENIIDDEGMV